MHHRPLQLLATERHVERALAGGRRAATWRSFLAGRVTESGRRAATPEITLLATALSLDELSEEHGWEASHALVRSLDEALGALRRAGVSADALQRAPGPRGPLLARALRRTDEILARAGIFDDRAIGFAAERCLERAAVRDLPERMVIDGLFAWDASQLAWVEALARRAPVTVRVPRFARPGPGVTSAPEAILTVLEERWHALSDAPDLEIAEIDFPADVRLIEAPSHGAEARAIAAEVLDALNRGVPAEGIAVVLPDLDEEFLEPLRACFDEAAIPFSEPRGRPPAAAPAVRAALGWLDLAAGPLDRDALLDLLRSNAVSWDAFVEDATPAARRRRALSLARRLSRVPVRTDRDGGLLLEVLGSELDEQGGDRWMIESLERIVRARGGLAEDATRAAFAGMLEETWATMGLAGGGRDGVWAFVKSEPGSRRAQLLASQIRERAAGFRALDAAMERVVEAAEVLGVAGAKIPTRRFKAELEDAIDGVAPLGTRRAGAVRVARASEIAGLDTEVLIAARASEPFFEPYGASHAILSDEILDALPKARRPATAERLAAARRTELLAAVAGARSLVLTRPSSDAEGRPAAPAALFAELARRAPVTRAPGSALDPRGRPLSARGAELVALGLGAPPRDPSVARRAAIERERLDFFLDPTKLAAATTGAVEAREPLAAALLRDTFGAANDRPVAATVIERAALCRFSAFAAKALGASSADAVGEGLEPWQRGSLIHRALKIALDATRPQWGKLGRAEILALGGEAARRALLRGKSAPLYRAEVERALRDVEAVLGWSFDDDSGFAFAYGERSFGEAAAASAGRRDRKGADAPWPALAIGSGAGTVFVKGRIDRVDLSRDGSSARIVDYKTGALPAWKDVGNTLFQPPLYASVLVSQLGPLSVPEIRALYLESARRPPRTLPAEKNQQLSLEAITAAERRAAEIMGKLWRGDVAPRPTDAAACARCDVRDVCRRPAAMPIEELEPENEGGAG